MPRSEVKVRVRVRVRVRDASLRGSAMSSKRSGGNWKARSRGAGLCSSSRRDATLRAVGSARQSANFSSSACSDSDTV